MNIEEQFNLIARKYDSGRRKFIPCFEDFYVRTTDFLAKTVIAPKNVLDLGAGTGLLTKYWYDHFPESQFVLADIAKDMLDIAKERFCGIDNVKYEICDYSKEFPSGDFDLIISALSVHHLEDTQKRELFGRIYHKLPDGGVFLNYDQFCAGDPVLNKLYDSYWENSLQNSGLTQEDIDLWRERRKLDKECSFEEQIKMLRGSGFRTVKCVYTYQKFSVIAAVK